MSLSQDRVAPDAGRVKLRKIPTKVVRAPNRIGLLTQRGLLNRERESSRAIFWGPGRNPYGCVRTPNRTLSEKRAPRERPNRPKSLYAIGIYDKRRRRPLGASGVNWRVGQIPRIFKKLPDKDSNLGQSG